jgi:hypothetical protein
MQISNNASAVVIVHLAYYKISPKWTGVYIMKRHQIRNLCLRVYVSVSVCARARVTRHNNCIEVATAFFDNNKRQTHALPVSRCAAR